jgi:hypothetical protein
MHASLKELFVHVCALKSSWSNWCDESDQLVQRVQLVQLQEACGVWAAYRGEMLTPLAVFCAGYEVVRRFCQDY